MKRLILTAFFIAAMLSGCTRLDETTEKIANEKEQTIDNILYECTALKFKSGMENVDFSDNLPISIYSSSKKICDGLLSRKDALLFHLFHPKDAHLSDGEYTIIHRRSDGEKRHPFRISLSVTKGSIVSLSTEDNLYTKYFGKGDGTEANPYQIKDISGSTNSFVAMSLAIQEDEENGNGIYFLQTCDLTFPSGDYDVTKVVIGCYVDNGKYCQFRGSFDGGEHSLTGYYIYNPPYEGVGLFHKLGNNAVIKNVVFYDAKIQSSTRFTGLLAGSIASGAKVTINNVDAIGCDVSGTSYVGGLIGKASGEFSIAECFFAGKAHIEIKSGVEGEGLYYGGIIGAVEELSGSSSIYHAYIDKDVTLEGNGSVGGIIGNISVGRDLSLQRVHNYSTSIYSAGDNCGGIIGNLYITSGTLKMLKCENGTDPDVSYTSAQLTGNSYVGGVIGHGSVNNDAKLILDSVRAGGNHTCLQSHYGGLIGTLEGSGSTTIDNSYHIKNGELSTGLNSGGLIGWVISCSSLTINNSYNDSNNLSGGDCMGGLIGTVCGSTVNISNSYNTGFLNGGIQVGGLIGACDRSTVTISSSNGAGSLDGTVDDTQILGRSGGNCIGGMVGYNSEGSLTISASGENPPAASSGFVGKSSALCNNTGGIIGYSIKSYVEINNIVSNASVTGGDEVGGIIGYIVTHDQSYLKINNVRVKCNGVKGSRFVGGIVGKFEGFNICLRGCKTEEGTAISASAEHAGGMVGWLESTDTCLGEFIQSCDNYADVSADSDAGGIVGRFEKSGTSYPQKFTINYSNNYGKISGTRTIGGIVGFIAGGHFPLIDQVINYGDVSNSNSDSEGGIDATDVTVGGIVGWVREGFNIQYSSNRGNVTSDRCRYTGGIAGRIGGSTGNFRTVVTCCFNTGRIHGGTDCAHQGGIVGALEDVPLDGSGIYDCYNTGEITGQKTAGIASYLGYGGDIHRCFHRGTGTSCPILQGFESSIHCENNYTNSDVREGKGDPKYLNDADFLKPEKFSGWDFNNTWVMGPSYPEIKYHREH